MSLPLKALPELSNLLDLLTQTLTSDIALFEAQKDTDALQKAIDYFGRDLKLYSETIKAWHTLSKTAEQGKQLQEIEIKIDQIQHLMTRAIGLIKT